MRGPVVPQLLTSFATWNHVVFLSAREAPLVLVVYPGFASVEQTISGHWYLGIHRSSRRFPTSGRRISHSRVSVFPFTFTIYPRRLRRSHDPQSDLVPPQARPPTQSISCPGALRRVRRSGRDQTCRGLDQRRLERCRAGYVVYMHGRDTACGFFSG